MTDNSKICVRVGRSRILPETSNDRIIIGRTRGTRHAKGGETLNKDKKLGIGMKVMLIGMTAILSGYLYYCYEYWSTPAPAWETNYEIALDKAKKQGKFLMVFFNDPQNSESRALRSEAFENSGFNNFADRHLVVLDARVIDGGKDVSKKNERLMEKFGIRCVPSIAFVNGLEQAGGIIEGYGNLPTGVSWLDILRSYKCNPGCCQVTNKCILNGNASEE